MEAFSDMKLDKFIKLCKVLTDQHSKHEDWVKAQSELTAIRNMLDYDIDILNQFNPVMLWTTFENEDQEFSDDLLNDFDNQVCVVQVCTWMLLEYYKNYRTAKTPDQSETSATSTSIINENNTDCEYETQLLGGIITYINMKYIDLFPDNLALLKDISRLAGRVSKLNWKTSHIFKEAIRVIIENLYVDGDFYSTATLWIYFVEIMNEIQQRRNDEVSDKLYVTDIFIVALKFFENVF